LEERARAPACRIESVKDTHSRELEPRPLLGVSSWILLISRTVTHSLACATVQAFTRHFSRSALGRRSFKFEMLTVENSYHLNHKRERERCIVTKLRSHAHKLTHKHARTHTERERETHILSLPLSLSVYTHSTHMQRHAHTHTHTLSHTGNRIEDAVFLGRGAGEL
jgi:hypothetical protein